LLLQDAEGLQFGGIYTTAKVHVEIFIRLSGSVMRADVLLSMPVLCCCVAAYQYHVAVAVTTAVTALDDV
jgi:hypothetical protein